MLTSPKYNGSPTVESLASGLATLGRYGDEYMVHAAEGETMIPAEVFEANPGLRDALFRQMQMMGIKDPNRFVVGDSMNSINPITGQPEFWFKKIWKGIKSVFKSVAPIVAPILGNAIAPGIGGIIASGLMTKLQGGSWGDVVKSAGIGWATQGVMSGLQSQAAGQGFLSGVGKGLSTPFSAAAGMFKDGAQNTFRQGLLGGLAEGGGSGVYHTGITAANKPAEWYNKLYPTYNENAQLGSAMPSDRMPLNWRGDNTPTDWDLDYEAPSYTDRYGHTNQIVDEYLIPTDEQQINKYRWDQIEGDDLRPVHINDKKGILQLQKYNDKGPTSLLEGGRLPPRVSNTGDFLPANSYDAGEVVTFTNGSQKQIVMEPGKFDKYTGATTAPQKVFVDYEAPGPLSHLNPTGKIERGLESLGVGAGTSKKIAPLLTTVGLGATISGLSALFTEKDIPDAGDPTYDAYDRWRKISDQDSKEAISLFREWYGDPFVTRSDFESSIGGNSSNPDWWFIPETLTANRGGEVMGPGTGTSDSIPARLSDGEFVMTAEAVRNAGHGNRDLGAARMYDMMSQFEGRSA